MNCYALLINRVLLNWVFPLKGESEFFVDDNLMTQKKAIKNEKKSTVSFNNISTKFEEEAEPLTQSICSMQNDRGNLSAIAILAFYSNKAFRFVLPRFHVPFWLSHILIVYLFYFVPAYVQARTEV